MSYPRSSRTGAGASAHARYAMLWAAGRRRRILAGGAAVLAAGGLAWWLVGFQFALGIAFMTVAAVLVAQWRHHDEAAAWRKGAAGERRTARMLRPLVQDGYVVLHDRALPRSQANLDHLVIGPSGVVVIDTKYRHPNTKVRSRRGQIWIGRESSEEMVQAITYETSRVAGELRRAGAVTVPVTSLMVVHGARLPRWGALTVAGVTVLRAGRARGWIKRLPPRLDLHQVAATAEWVERLFPAKTD